MAAAGRDVAALFDTRGGSAELRATICDSAFWGQVDALRFVIAPLRSLSQWLKGCSCHEEELKRGQIIQCRWKGCRAREFGSKAEQTVATLYLRRRDMYDAARPEACSITAATILAMPDLQAEFC